MSSSAPTKSESFSIKEPKEDGEGFEEIIDEEGVEDENTVPTSLDNLNAENQRALLGKKRQKKADSIPGVKINPAYSEVIKTPALSPMQIKELKHDAAGAFDCKDKYATFVGTVADMFNEGMCFTCFKCDEENTKDGGSLFLTHINGEDCNPQHIFGVPKLEYPYTQNSFKNKNKSEKGVSRGLKYITVFPSSVRKYYLSNKWNGTNILFFKYKDLDGNVCVSAKTKGSAQVTDNQYGKFLTLTLQSLGFDTKSIQLPLSENNRITKQNCPEKLKQFMENDNYQSISFELCGRLEPHLVKYDFDIDLKPLFYIYKNGEMAPCINTHKGKPHSSPATTTTSSSEAAEEHPDLGPFKFTSPAEVVERCAKTQLKDYQYNERFRVQNNLKVRYEYDHFITEGYVLYLLDEFNQIVPKRTLYKVKPEDIEEVHWDTFNVFKQGQVKEAVKKMIQREKQLTIENLMQELDMGPKEWNKWGGLILSFIRKNNLLSSVKPKVPIEAKLLPTYVSASKKKRSKQNKKKKVLKKQKAQTKSSSSTESPTAKIQEAASTLTQEEAVQSSS